MKNILPFLFCLLPLFAPDTGGTGDGSLLPFDFSEWIKRVDAAGSKKDRAAIGEELSKVLRVSVADAWKALDKARLSAAGSSGENKDSDQQSPEKKADEKKQLISLRHKTSYPHYRRAGLVLTNQFKPYEVTAEQLAVLKDDAWVEIGK